MTTFYMNHLIIENVLSTHFLKHSWKIVLITILKVEKEETTGLEVKKETDVLMKHSMHQKEFFVTWDVKKRIENFL